MSLNEDDYYGILGVSYECNDKQIKSAFRKLALQYHPDHNSSPEAKQKFRKILEAYEILKDPQKRAVYNQFYHETFKDHHKTFEINKENRRHYDSNRIIFNDIKRIIFIICGISPLIYGIISLFTWNIKLGIISIGLLILISRKGYLAKIGQLIVWLILFQAFLAFIRLIWRII